MYKNSPKLSDSHWRGLNIQTEIEIIAVIV